MKIFDFIKNVNRNAENSEKKNVSEIQNEKIENNNIIDITAIDMVSYYDEFGKEQKMPKSDWIKNILNPAIEGSWENPEELYTIILNSFSKKMYNETKDACLRLYSLDSNKIRKTNTLALFYIKTEKYNEAIELYRRYIANERASETIFTNYGKVLEMTGNIEEAEKNYMKTLSLNPNSETAFLNFFKIVRKRNFSEYEKRLEQYANIEGAWRAKLKLAVDYFRAGNKQMGDHYLIKALKESNHNTEVMAMASGIYSANNLFSDFEKHVLSVYNPEKHGAFTTLNVLEYYRRKGIYRKGLELCKFVSKFAWSEYSKNFQEFEETFLNMLNQNENRKNRQGESFFSTNVPLWYSEFNEPDWLLNSSIRTKPNLLILPFTALKVNEEESSKVRKDINNLAISIPLFFNDYLHFNTEANYQFVSPLLNREIVIPDKKYSKEYMELIKAQNPLLDYILAGNVSEIKHRVYDIIDGVEEGSRKKEKPRIEYEVEVYLYNCSEETKISLIDSVYPEKEIYRVQNDIIRRYNEYFGISNNFKVNDSSNIGLFSYAQKFKFLIEDSRNKKYHSWKYKELLSSQINIVLEDKKNELKKINLVELLYEIYNINSQLLKAEKPTIYNMIERNIFDTQTARLILPVIFNIYNDEENYNKSVEMIQKEIPFGNKSSYIDWINKFVDYAN